MKILYVTTIGGTMSFFKSFIRTLLDDGHVVDIATNERFGNRKVPTCYRQWGCNVYQISCSRNPFSLGNLRAITDIRKLVQDGHYDLVHCHTPIAATCTRIACRPLRKKFGTKILYTAHGFHFYSGAPLMNWIIYWPIEWFCSWCTDILITINTEDFERAKKHLHAKKTEYVPGVGVDISKFVEHNDGKRIREEFGIDDDTFIILSVGELNKNKNHEAVIKAIADIKNIVYMIVGAGELHEHLKKVADSLDVNVILTGFRSDVADFYNVADCYILPSIREGLNVSLIEAMIAGCPCLCGRIRGNTDLIEEQGGFLFNPSSTKDIRKAIDNILISNQRKEIGEYNSHKACKYDIVNVNRLMKKIYDTLE